MNTDLMVKQSNWDVLSQHTECNETDIIKFATEKTDEIQKISGELMKAKSAAKTAANQVKQAKEKADEAQGKAENLKEKIGWFESRRTAIENTNAVVKAMADAEVELVESQHVLADAQQRVVEAQEKSFAFQKQLAEITAAMIMFSTVNIATSRTIVRELEMRLEGAGRKKLTSLARKEVESVISQIKAQQDIMGRQNQLGELLRQQADISEIHSQHIQEQIECGARRDIRIEEHEQHLRNQQRTLNHQVQRIEGYEEQLTEISNKIVEQTDLITQNIEKGKEQDKVIAVLQDEANKRDQRIEHNQEKNEEQDRALAKITTLQNEHGVLIAQSVEKAKVQDETISKMQDVDNGQKELIKQNCDKIKEQDRIFAELFVENQERDMLIAQNGEEIQKHAEWIKLAADTNDQQNEILAEQQGEISLLQSKVEQLEMLLAAKGDKKWLIAATAASAVALIISIIHFFI